MKANLMIGDWVKPNPSISSACARVRMVFPDGILIDGIINKIGLDEITPMFLTKEILKANGFEQSGDYYTRTSYLDGHTNLVILSYSVKFRYLDAKRMINKLWTSKIYSEMSYVHELQHAMHLMGLENLADDFIIEKGDKL